MTALRLTYAACLLVGLGYLVIGAEYSLGAIETPGDGLYPMVVGVIFTALSLAAVIKSLHSGEDSALAAEAFPRGANLRRVCWVALSLVFFAALFHYLGFVVCALPLMWTMLRISGSWNWFKNALVSVALVALSYALFVEILGVPLPRGSVWG